MTRECVSQLLDRRNTGAGSLATLHGGAIIHLESTT